MNELISINSSTIGGQTINTVNARDLHSFLEAKKDFSEWIKDRIEKYGFVENQDYVVVEVLRSPESGSSKARVQRAIDYHLSIDMAKELSMVERNERGKQARLYFLECERRAQAATPSLQLPNFLDPASAAIAWAEQYQRAQQAERTKAEIGSRREATAMSTASREAKKARKLEIVLDRDMEYASIKRMSAIHHGLKFDWRMLKSTCAEMGIPPVEVFDANYGHVNAYHISVWKEAYAVDLAGNTISFPDDRAVGEDFNRDLN